MSIVAINSFTYGGASFYFLQFIKEIIFFCDNFFACSRENEQLDIAAARHAKSVKISTSALFD